MVRKGEEGNNGEREKMMKGQKGVWERDSKDI